LKLLVKFSKKNFFLDHNLFDRMEFGGPIQWSRMEHAAWFQVSLRSTTCHVIATTWGDKQGVCLCGTMLMTNVLLEDKVHMALCS